MMKLKSFPRECHTYNICWLPLVVNMCLSTERYYNNYFIIKSMHTYKYLDNLVTFCVRNMLPSAFYGTTP